jgi:hypothetical protein
MGLSFPQLAMSDCLYSGAEGSLQEPVELNALRMAYSPALRIKIGAAKTPAFRLAGPAVCRPSQNSQTCVRLPVQLYQEASNISTSLRFFESRSCLYSSRVPGFKTKNEYCWQ